MFDILICGIIMSGIIHMSHIILKNTQIGRICVLFICFRLLLCVFAFLRCRGLFYRIYKDRVGCSIPYGVDCLFLLSQTKIIRT
jgi:hypothetical protein